MKLLFRWFRELAVKIKFRKIQFRSIGRRCVFKSLSSTYVYSENISLADDVHIGPRSLLDGAGIISIGRGSIIAPDVQIFSRTHNFDKELTSLPFDNVMLTAPVKIGEFVWIGSRAQILPGVTVGDGAVIGAGAVVARDVPSCAVVVGNPAKVVRYRDKETFERLKGQENPFVYSRWGREKIFRSKN